MKGGAASVLVSSSAGVPGLSQNRVETSTIASVEGSSQPQAIGLSVCAFAFFMRGVFCPPLGFMALEMRWRFSLVVAGAMATRLPIKVEIARPNR